MEDEEPEESLEPTRRDLVELFRQVFERRNRLDQDLETLLKSEVPLGVLSDIITHALGLPSRTKQGLLAEPKVERRVNMLRSILRNFVDRDPVVRIFPPHFSTN
jgi:hypothetical protein